MTDSKVREHFYERLRWALLKGRHEPVRSREPLFPPLEATLRGAGRGVENGDGPQPEALAQFERELLGAGGSMTRLRDREALRSYLEQFVRDQQVRSAVAGAYPILERLGVLDILQASGVVLRSWSLHDNQIAPQPFALPRAGRQELAAAELGVTGVDRAIAETGTIVVSSRPGRARLTSLAPPIHLAVMLPADLVPSVEDFFADLRHASLTDPSRAASSTTLITGASRTGDIEHKLTRGVHGPKAVHVMYWEGELPEAGVA